ncbi:MAG: lysozyme [Prevotellaceae bacterium]|jgi:lysozyme|nr:lysozyme [Prevotellaceae bacterium]
MKTSQRGIELLKVHEGLRLVAYKCPAGVWTIGYGHTGPDVTVGKTITQAEAEQLLRADVAWAERAVSAELPGVNQNQFDALVPFTYNVGAGAFKGSTLLRKAKANAGDPAIRAEFVKWQKSGGQVLPGLVKRRAAEYEL